MLEALREAQPQMFVTVIDALDLFADHPIDSIVDFQTCPEGSMIAAGPD